MGLFSWEFCREFAWSEHTYSPITSKIVCVERENVRHAVAEHRRHKTGIVCRFSPRFALGDKLLPLLINGPLVAEQSRKSRNRI